MGTRFRSARRRAAEFERRTREAAGLYRSASYAAGRPLGWSDAARVHASAGEASPPRSRWHFAVRDAAAALTWTWTRIDPDGWFRPSYAWWLVSRIATGRRDIRGAWTSFANNPRHRRYSRRRLDCLRVVGRLDSTTRKVAGLYGWWSRYPVAPRWIARVPGPVLARAAGYGGSRTLSDGPSRPHPVPRWVVRRARLVRWFVAAVASGHVRPAAVPDAWAYAAAASDGIDTTPRPGPISRAGRPDHASRSTRTGGDPAADADRRQ